MNAPKDSAGHGTPALPNEAIDVSIIIVNWRSKDFVRKCLRSIAAHAGDVTVETIVVDGASFDGCGEMLAAEFPHIRFIQANENRGFAYANNLGAREAKGHYLLLLNPDTELHPGALSRLVAAHNSEPNCGMVGPRILNTDGTLQRSCVQALPTPLNQAFGSELLLKWLPNSSLWGSGQAFSSKKPSAVEAISGACMLIKRSRYSTLEGFDERYFMYAEDMDLCKRIQTTGLKVFHVPDSTILHHGGQSSKSQPSQISVRMMRVSLEQYFLIHHGRISAAAYRILQLLSAQVRILVLIITYPFSDSPARSHAQYSLRKWRTILLWALSLNKSEALKRQSRLPTANLSQQP